MAELTHDVSERTTEDDQLLDELTFLSAELARLAAETRYRMSATRAYAQLSTDRLASLHISPVRGFQTLADFTERRLMPAVRTCDSFSARIEDLLQRAAWTSELLRTRIDIALAKQNRDLLTSMDRRTQAAIAAAADGRGPVDRRDQLLSGRADRLRDRRDSWHRKGRRGGHRGADRRGAGRRFGVAAAAQHGAGDLGRHLPPREFALRPDFRQCGHQPVDIARRCAPATGSAAAARCRPGRSGS